MLYALSRRAGLKTVLHFTCASLALAAFTHAAVKPSVAQERSERNERSLKKKTYERKQKPQTAPAAKLDANGPLTLLISLNQQRMFVYDANGLMTQTPVSTGTTGHETPKGIYSILEKKRDHASNIYAGAPMPHMQRLLMTGIAMHGGVVPGYPASHGCVRLPFDFARRFFEVTDINQRVVIAPDVHAPVAFEHRSLFSALPSGGVIKPGDRAESTRETAVNFGSDVAEAVLGVSSAHAATEPPGRTLESAAEARRDERARLVASIEGTANRGKAAEEAQKAAGEAVASARDGAKKARADASKLARDADKAKDALQKQDRTLKTIARRLEKEANKLRSDQLEELRAAEAEERARIAPTTEAAANAAAAAKAAQDAVKAADAAVVKAQNDLKSAKAEIKAAADAEKSAKDAVARFDRLEQYRDLPVSVFISSATGTIAVRQGFERVLELPVTIDNIEQPLDTFLITAVGWKDDSRTELRWMATEVNENSTGSYPDDDNTRTKKARVKPDPRMPDVTDTSKIHRTLDRIKLPREATEKLAELVKPGSTMIVSSYNVSKSETRYSGTDFIVQMPEVVAKITKPTPRPKPVEVVEESSGGFFFFGPPPSETTKRNKKRSGPSKQGFW